MNILINENKDIKITNNVIDNNKNINEINNINNNNSLNDLFDNKNKEENKDNINKESNIYQNNYINKVEMLEFLIDIIKKYSYNKIKNEIIEKNKKKIELENNINILTSKINNIKIQKKNYKSLSKSIKNEREYIDKNMKINLKDYLNEDDLLNIKNEINILIMKIKKEKNELTNNNIKISEIKREIYLIKDDIKKYNNSIRQMKTENDIYLNSIRLLDRHIKLIKEKLEIQNDKSNDFFIALTNLALKSKKCEMQRINTENNNKKRAKSCKGNKIKNVFYNFNFL